jgi:hypothetical protein
MANVPSWDSYVDSAALEFRDNTQYFQNVEYMLHVLYWTVKAIELHIPKIFYDRYLYSIVAYLVTLMAVTRSKACL